MGYQTSFSVRTSGRGTYDVTGEVRRAARAAGVEHGLCNVFVHHTSASIIVCENADPAVRSDLERFLARAVPDGDALFDHTMEGPDDMPAHVRAILTGMSLNIPVTGGDCALGTWQGIYLYEHRARAHTRRLTVTVY